MDIECAAIYPREPLSRFQRTILAARCLVAAANGFDTAAVGLIAPARDFGLLFCTWTLISARTGSVETLTVMRLFIGAGLAQPCPR
jgi:hypothetical protein